MDPPSKVLIHPLTSTLPALLQELESRLAEYVEKGISLEADILASASAVLPAEFQQMVPQELKDFYGRPLGTATVVETTVTSYSTTGNETEEVVVEPAWTAPPSSFLANQSGTRLSRSSISASIVFLQCERILQILPASSFLH